jgi:predicted SAM-dependent methyltransferase
MKIILGAGGTKLYGWLSTEKTDIDIREREDFESFLNGEKAEAFLLDHVVEHVEVNNLQVVLSNLYQFLQTGGYVRIAVPDGLHADPEYIEWVRPGGSGPGCKEHQSLFTYKTLYDLLVQAGFQLVELEEWWDENENFTAMTHKMQHRGYISRCYFEDLRNADGYPRYTSLIIDAWRME